jgi:biotin carboxyl carrier protein
VAARMRLSGPGGETDAVAPSPAGTECRVGRSDADEIDTRPREGAILRVGGRTVEVHRDGDAVWLVDDGVPTRWAPALDLAARHVAAGSLEAPMPGVVLDVRTQSGASVEEGDVLLVLESMKMELTVVAPRDGTVGEVHVRAGDHVKQGEILVSVGRPEAERVDQDAGPDAQRRSPE